MSKKKKTAKQEIRDIILAATLCFIAATTTIGAVTVFVHYTLITGNIWVFFLSITPIVIASYAYLYERKRRNSED